MCKDYGDKRDYDCYGGDRGGRGGWEGDERNWEGKRGWDDGGRGGDFRDEHGPFGFHRRFISKREQLEELEDYYVALMSEAEGVLEAIEELREEFGFEEEAGEIEEEKEKKPRKKRGRKAKKETAEEKSAE
ncbi:MAG: hypothetical protein FJ088_06100 [Deltaproteobacteria bacterium]|nr:hypothetical protein [Deltaproteobacteria bacterium]